MLTDLRFALRSLIKAPGFTAIALLTLALGIGANTAIFSYVYAVLLRPLPFANQERLAAVYATVKRDGTFERRAFSLPDFRDYSTQLSKNFLSFAAYASDSLTLTGDGAPERLSAELVSGNYFSTLGVNAQRGRLLLPDDDAKPGAASVVLISDELWRSRFGARENVVGQTLKLNDTDLTVIGVLPPGFRGVTDDAKIWIPMSEASIPMGYDAWNTRGSRWHEAVGWLKPGVTLAQANAELAAAGVAIGEANAGVSKDYSATATSLREELFGSLRQPLLLVLGAVAFVLLITCVNVANLMLVRLNGRRAELSVRAALGADRLQLARLFLAESIVLGLVGGAAALLVAQWGIDGLHALNPVNLPGYILPTLSWPVFLFAAGLALLSTLAIGLLPAWEASRHDLVSSLKEAGRTGAPGNHRVRSALMAAEIALALALITGAGLMVKSYRELSRLDPGYRQSGVLAAYLELPAARYKDAAQSQAFMTRLLERLRALPGVQSVALASDSPLDGNDTASTWFSDSPAAEPKQNEFRGFIHAVSPEFFTTEGIAFVEGGTFDPNLTPTSEPVAIVSESVAKRYWPGANAVGHRLKRGRSDSKNPWIRIVGVVREIKYRSLPNNPTVDPDLYFPLIQMGRRSFSFVAHTENSASALLPEARKAVLELDRELPLFNTGTIESRIARRTAGPRFTAQLIGLFSSVALVLACLGIYGVVSFNVGLRTQEIGVRQALGASRGDIFRLVLFGTGRITAIGLGVGLVLAFALSRALRSQLYNVAATDPWVYALGALLLALVALFAAWLPARRAARIDPMRALRAE